MDIDEYMTVAEAAKELKITRSGAYWRIENGTLPSQMVHGRMLVPRDAVHSEINPQPRKNEDIGMLLGSILGG